MKVAQFFNTILFIVIFSITVIAQNNSIPITKKQTSCPDNIATQWMNHITAWIRNEAVPPGPSLRIFAYGGLSIYESQLPGMKDYQSLYTYFTGDKILFDNKKTYYPAASANAAIAEILRKLAFLKSHNNQIDSLELNYYTLLQKQTNSRQLEASVSFGKLVADSIFEWSKTDGMFVSRPPYVVHVGPGLWEASPGKQDYPVPYNPYLGLTRTFCKGNIMQFDPGPPPLFSTDTGSCFYKDAC